MVRTPDESTDNILPITQRIKVESPAVDLTIPERSMGLVHELRDFTNTWVSYVAGYGVENRNDIAITAHFTKLGISTVVERIAHYIPRNVTSDTHSKQYIQAYRTLLKTKLNLDLIVQKKLAFIVDDQHILAIGEIFRGTPAFDAVRWAGHVELVEYLKEHMDENTDNRIPVVERLYPAGDYVGTTSIVLPEFTASAMPETMYPFLNVTPRELWDGFKASNSNVVILIGPPGTGKSSFIREVLDYRGWDKETYLADSTDTITHPKFVERVRDLPSESMVVTEDSDQLLIARENGNTAMATLLNTTNGLASTDTKFLIATNLSSVNKTDDAIIRRGRLYKVLTFRKLTLEEARAVREMWGMDAVDLSSIGSTVSLADAMNYSEGESPTPLKQGPGYL